MPESIDDFTRAGAEAGDGTLIYPASFSQERLWFLQELAPESAANNLPAVVRLYGQVNLPALEQSLQQLVGRYQILRTGFRESGGQLLQLVSPAVEFNLRLVDLRTCPPGEQSAELHARIQAEIGHPFDLSRPPLLRATLVRLGPLDQVLIVVFHLSAADAWSLGLFSQELARLYGALVANEPCTLAPVPLQFGDYAAWERQQAEGSRWQEQLAFWRRHLAGEVPSLRLGQEETRPGRLASPGADYRFELPLVLVQRLKGLCREERTTLFMVLLAGFDLLLYAQSGQTDLVIGTPVLGRGREELEGLVGCLVNLLVLRTNAAGDPAFSQFLARIKETVLTATAHEEVPFERVLEALRLKRCPGQNPLLRAVFTLQREPAHLRLPGLHGEALPTPCTGAKFDLFLEWSELGPRLQGRFEYNSARFTREQIQLWAARYQKLLEALVANPYQRLAELAALVTGGASLPGSEPAFPPAECPQPVRAETLKLTDLRRSIEQVLADIWRQVLRVGQVGRQDNFFERGGHSLLLLQVQAKLRRACDLNLPLPTLFATPVLAELAALIEERLLQEIETLSALEA